MKKDKAKETEAMVPAEAETKRDALARVPQTLPTEIDINLVREKFAAIQQFQKLVQSQLHENLDYGVIPGTKKNTLLKPGAEKIAKLLDLADTFEVVDKLEDWDKGFFFYNFKCRLVSLLTGQVVSEGVGSCNSKEKKYRWLWVTADGLPKGVDPASLVSQGAKRTLSEFEFAINRGETTGKYGKSAEYWDRWRKAIKEGRAKPTERKTRSGDKMLKAYELVVDETMYRIPNDDPYTLANTIEKMAKKRSMVDAALSVGRLSELFTQDLEDLDEDHGGFHHEAEPEPEGSGQPITQAAPKEAPKAEPKASAKPPAEKPKPAPPKAAPAKKADEEEAALAAASGEGPEDESPFPSDVKQTDGAKKTIEALKEFLGIAFGKTFKKDYVEFKDWLGNVAGPGLGHNFVGLEHGAWSLTKGDVASLLFLWENRSKALEGFARYRAKPAAAEEK